MGNLKTNAMRILDKKKINYEVLTYDNIDGKIDGISVSEKIGKDSKIVYKTLITIGHSNNYYVFVIPVCEEIDMKKAAKAANEKNIEMIHVKDINKVTGYIRGGCSPLGMKKNYNTYIDKRAKDNEEIVFSAGKIGFQIALKIEDLENTIDFKYTDLIK
ncbi:Cys-tRNA(Pro) deacylase [Clostridium sp.]|uniref:Cys-tRNA(Pro) deacylase n=1 Tax=Clostridium sp. TaxID=1506 RepID=UPI002608CCDE|nr:Cys-tRNA(Pro) deacylase [Clostridium sp.]